MSKKKILLVDDSNVVLSMEKLILGQKYDLICAKNGEEAIEKATSNLPNLILLDVIMPKMNGFETCQNLRNQEVTKSIPIIMVTTRGEEENKEQGFYSGCTDYVTKPFNNAELLSKVKSYLGE